MGDERSRTEIHDGPVEVFKWLCRYLSTQIEPIFQAALVRDAAFAPFYAEVEKLGDDLQGELEHFRWHPSTSLTWCALEALEQQKIVHLVEYIGGARYKVHFSDAVHESVERLRLHRNKISHPYMKGSEWRSKMREFEAEQGEHEPRVPLVWSVQSVLNKELLQRGLEPRQEFIVTLEMANMVREIWQVCMKPAAAATIPPPETLAQVLMARQKAMILAYSAGDASSTP